MRSKSSFQRSLPLFAALLAISSQAQATDAPPSPPPPAQLAIDKGVVETETGTDLTSKKQLKTENGLHLLANGQDVPPFCLDKMLMGEAQLPKVAIATCNTDPEKKIIKTYREDGWTKTDYRISGEEGEYPAMTAMYRVIGDVADGTALEIYSATGGSGRFTSVVVVQVDGPDLKLIHSFGGGDRCNGGVADAEIKKGMLNYGLYITPGDFTTVAYGDDQGIVAYEDLEASAASCFAIARYQNAALTEVELLPDAIKNSESTDWSTSFTMQKCFNQRISDTIKSGKTILSPEAFKDFVGSFLNTCKKA